MKFNKEGYKEAQAWLLTNIQRVGNTLNDLMNEKWLSEMWKKLHWSNFSVRIWNSCVQVTGKKEIWVWEFYIQCNVTGITERIDNEDMKDMSGEKVIKCTDVSRLTEIELDEYH